MKTHVAPCDPEPSHETSFHVRCSSFASHIRRTAEGFMSRAPTHRRTWPRARKPPRTLGIRPKTSLETTRDKIQDPDSAHLSDFDGMHGLPGWSCICCRSGRRDHRTRAFRSHLAATSEGFWLESPHAMHVLGHRTQILKEHLYKPLWFLNRAVWFLNRAFWFLNRGFGILVWESRIVTESEFVPHSWRQTLSTRIEMARPRHRRRVQEAQNHHRDEGR